MRIPSEIRKLAGILRSAAAPDPLVQMGEISIRHRRWGIGNLQYNRESFELLKGLHDYVIDIGGTEVEVSAQMYLNSYQLKLVGWAATESRGTRLKPSEAFPG